jgi:type I restriction enzyme, S subunit
MVCQEYLPKLDKTSVISGNSISLSISIEHNTKFIHQVLLQHRLNGTFKKEVQQTGQPFISLGVVDNMDIPTPPFDEQQQIVEYLDIHTKEIDDLVSLEQKKIDLLIEYRQSLISEVITGKIDVRTNVN